MKQKSRRRLEKINCILQNFISSRVVFWRHSSNLPIHNFKRFEGIKKQQQQQQVSTSCFFCRSHCSFWRLSWRRRKQFLELTWMSPLIVLLLLWKSSTARGSFMACRSTRPNYFQPYNCIAIVYQSICYRKIADQLYFNRIAEKNLDGCSWVTKNGRDMQLVQGLPLLLAFP